jgi:DNA-binding GntR family transcriptional regulator
MPIPAETIAGRLGARLADEIITGVLAPGTKLDERELAERFSVSRTPIREALRELKARGLVELTPRRSIIVATIGIERLEELLDAECELEALCARRAAESMTTMERKELEHLHERSLRFVEAGDDNGYLAINREFHLLVGTGTHNAVLASMARDLRDRLAPFRAAQSDVENRLARSHEEHGAIIAAIVGGDAERAFLAMREHNARLSTHVVRLIRERSAEAAVAS